MEKETVVILGASDHPGRYSHMAQVLLLEKGHIPLPVNPRLESIEGIKCFPHIKDIDEKIDTLTVYVNPHISDSLAKEIFDLGVKRVIFNPGSENESLYKPLRKRGVEIIEACTLVMLRTGQF
ncbi:MAG: CoA-binding protein [Deltaproteobacteria bacterium]|nr:MAG: CoA-binding protein [Deltaproteobacteria bacterium]